MRLTKFPLNHTLFKLGATHLALADVNFDARCCSTYDLLHLIQGAL